MTTRALSVVLMLCLLMTCSSGLMAAYAEQQTELPEVTLKLCFPGDRRAATDEVWNTVEERTKDELKAKFEVYFIPWDDYANKISILIASGDDFDLAYDASWLMFAQMVNKEAYLDLKDLSPQYMPNYYKALEEKGLLDSAMVNGQMLCVPWTPIFVNNPFVKWHTTLSGMEAAGLGNAYPNGSIATIEELDAALQAVKKRVPNKHYWDIVTDHRYSQTAILLMAIYVYD